MLTNYAETRVEEQKNIYLLGSNKITFSWWRLTPLIYFVHIDLSIEKRMYRKRFEELEESRPLVRNEFGHNLHQKLLIIIPQLIIIHLDQTKQNKTKPEKYFRFFLYQYRYRCSCDLHKSRKFKKCCRLQAKVLRWHICNIFCAY